MNPPLRNEIRALVARLSATTDPFADGEDLIACGVLCSLNLLELVAALEDRFSIRVGHRDLVTGRLRSVDSILELVGDHP